MDTRTRCDWSDLHTDECGHCRGGDDGSPALFVASSPARRPRERPVREQLVPQRPPWPITPPAETAEYPLLCSRDTACRPPDDGGPRRVGGRSHLCPVCEDRARDDLAEVEAAWPDLQERVAAIRAVDAAAARVSGDTPGTGIVLDEAVSQAVHDTVAQAQWWARLVMRERGHIPPDATPVGLLGWLGRSQVPWIAAHRDREVAVAFADDASRLARQVRSAAYPAGWRTIPLPVGCDVQVPVDGDCEGSPGGPCPGRLTARIRPDLGRMPDLVCDADAGHVVPPSVWQRPGWKHAALREDAVRAFLGRLRPRHADSDG